MPFASTVPVMFFDVATLLAFRNSPVNAGQVCPAAGNDSESPVSEPFFHDTAPWEVRYVYEGAAFFARKV